MCHLQGPFDAGAWGGNVEAGDKGEAQTGVIPMLPTETISEWHGFYGAVAGVGATLVGLVFVAISIHVARSPADTRTRRLAVMISLR